ncbi:PilZ domain-containing protein [Oceanobacter mangrovi]|uniref:PilZ domain-containing protein n=1 Tax=Oceanobacter mangrovi TaxID=2862510 RepID=UPI001C8EDE63|nr:PilZ domain-containing protein [Oceanobacter mangrovi]
MYHSEKRDFRRMTVETNAKISVNGVELAVTCVDLSSTGARMISQSPTGLADGDKGIVEIQSGGGHTAPLEADFTVIRVSDVDDHKEEVAVRFDEVR